MQLQKQKQRHLVTRQRVNKLALVIGTLLLSNLSFSAYAHECSTVNYKAGDVVHVSSAQNLGTRISLPANLIKPPVITNARLWDIGGETGTNQIVVSPNSNNKLGNKAMVFAFADNGKVYDIMVTRVAQKAHQPCVTINERPNFFFAPTPEKKPAPKPVAKVEPKTTPKLEKGALVSGSGDAAYPQMFTQYKWDKKKEVYPQNLIADVYDNGRTTFIRLANRHQGSLLVETKIGNKNTLIPVSHNDDYSIFSVNGVYGRFDILVGNSNITVTR